MNVSIIIPNYNNAEYLSACLDSCLEQEEVVKEIIIVDDHSTDNSWEILEGYRSRQPDLFQIFKNSGKGAPAARNYGFERSSGNLIQFLDADDLLSKGKIQRQLQRLKDKGPLALASCGWVHFHKDPCTEEIHPTPNPSWKDYSNPTNYLAEAWQNRYFFQTACWLVPRKLLERSGQWNEGLLRNQDGEFSARLILAASQLVFTPDVLVFYRKPQAGRNISKRKDRASVESLLRSYRLYETHVREKKGTEESLLKGCGQCYISFIQEFPREFPDLRREAAQSIKNLKLGKKLYTQPGRFNQVARIFSLEFAIFVLVIIRSLKKTNPNEKP